jgi:hypothetical protein
VIREGSLDLVPYGSEWHVLFARYDWGGGAMSPLRVTGRDTLIKVLKEQISLIPEALSKAIKRMDAGESVSIPNVFLSDETRLRLGLVSPAEGIAPRVSASQATAKD